MALALSALLSELSLSQLLHEDRPITGINSPEAASNTELTFISRSKYLSQLADSQAAAVLLPPALQGQAPQTMQEIIVADPYLAYAQLSHLFRPLTPAAPGIHPSAVVASDAQVDDSAVIGPFVVVAAGAVIGARVRLGAHVVLGEQVEIGADSELKPHVVCYPGVMLGRHCLVHAGTVLGSDGFGYAPSEQGWVKIAQNGRLIIADDVEIGANSALDRGAIANSVIGRGSKLDNLVHLAHNVELGERVALAAQVGIAGSTKVGDRVTVGGQSGMAGHLLIGADTHFTGQAMVTKSVSQPGVYSSGLPAKPNAEWRKNIALLHRLQQLEQKIKALEISSRDNK